MKEYNEKDIKAIVEKISPLLDELIEYWPSYEISLEDWVCSLKFIYDKSKLIWVKRVSDWDNTYDIPANLEEHFYNGFLLFPAEWTDEWYEACAEFDEKYSEYQI